MRAVLRVEKKQDEILKVVSKLYALKQGSPAQLEPMSYPTQGACPLCQKKVEYYPVVFSDNPAPVVIRACGCEPTVRQLPIQGEKI
jgi:hypothetical protein